MFSDESEASLKLKEWFDEGSWISCKVVEGGLEMCKKPIRKCNQKKESHSNSTIFEWLDGNENNSLVVPLGENETFSSEKRITVVDSEITKDSILLRNEFDDGNIQTVKDLIDEDIGNILPLFISHILCSEEYEERCFKLGNIFFKSVHIFGTVVNTQIINKSNVLVIDDGTAEITCYIEDFINDFVAEGTRDELNVESSFYEVLKYFNEQSIESKYTLPKFVQIELGDKVLITGDLSLHKGNYYIFVENISRPRGNSCHIEFMKDVFSNFETSYYDF